MTAESPVAQKVTQTLDIITAWISMHERILERFETQDYFGYEQFARSNAYSTILIHILGLSIEESPVSPLLSMSTFQKLDHQLNLIKTKAMEALIHILEYVYNSLSHEEREVVPFVRKMEGVAPMLIKTAQSFATHPQLITLLENDTCSEFMVQLIEILIILCGEQVYYNVFIDHQTQIIVSVCLNLMQTTQTEAELIKSDPSEFVNLALDCCDKQKSLIIKSQACKLLEHMCDNVDGAATCVSTFACNALNCALQTQA